MYSRECVVGSDWLRLRVVVTVTIRAHTHSECVGMNSLHCIRMKEFSTHTPSVLLEVMPPQGSACVC